MERKKSDYEKIEEMKNKYQEHSMTTEQVASLKKRIEEAKRKKRRDKWVRMARAGAAAAAALALFIVLPNTSQSVAHAMSAIPIVGRLVEVVTFRDYQYEGDRNEADITVPELVADTESLPEESAKQETLKKTTEEINAEIREITDRYVAEFEAGLKEEQGYQNVMVTSEVLSTGEDYFTLKLICYQGAGSGMEWNYFYTIDLNTGERLQLADLFAEGADYITPISENIKTQMREQMAADESVMYWLEEDVPEGVEDWNFHAITEETSFYLNEDDNIVICFNEGDVAPMYMGTVEFVIPDEAVASIRR